MPAEFTAEYKPRNNKPDKPILLSRGNSQTRVSIEEAERLMGKLSHSINVAKLTKV